MTALTAGAEWRAAAMLVPGARRAFGRVTLGAEVGLAVYRPVCRTALVPLTLAAGF